MRHLPFLIPSSTRIFDAPPATALVSFFTLTVLACSTSNPSYSDDPTPAPAATFGQACSTSTKCGDQLQCVTLQDGGPSLCTTTCDSSAECRNRYGVAVCIVDPVTVGSSFVRGSCARDCSTASCPAGQTCDKNSRFCR